MIGEGIATAPAVSGQQGWLRRFFVRRDPVYDRYAAIGQANSPGSKIFYLIMHLVPGLLAWALINVKPVYEAELRLTGLPGRWLQYALFIIFAFGWHMVTPVMLLRFKDGLTLKQTMEFLSLSRIDIRGLFVVFPVYCALFALVALPYMQWVWNPLQVWLQSIPLFRMPHYTIFSPDLYKFPPFALLFLFIGNFLGEELYFRGYLMKKIAFMGNAAWVVNSLLFAIYHFWQVPQSWPLLGLAPAFGLLMRFRKNLYVLVAFHFFVNMWLTYGDYPLRYALHLAK